METRPPGPRLCANPTCRSPIPPPRRSTAKYCSTACQSVVSSRNHNARRRGQVAWTPGTATRTCARAGCDAAVAAERARHGGRYCSDQCARAARRERSAAHTKRTRALARQRRAARRDRALASRLEAPSADTTARIPEHFAAVDAAARGAGTTAIISTGWDPGLFSLQRLYGESILPQGETYTFWGRGLSQGHSDAVRRVPGVAGGVQYTTPSEDAVVRVRAGERPALSTREKHTRECFVVLEEGADPDAVREAIVTMPDYFEPYDTTVTFITAAELARDHAGAPHGGFVIRSGTTSDGVGQTVEFQLALESNPEFTASVLVAYARAAARLSASGDHGAKSPFDIAPGLLSPKSPEQLRAELL